MDLTVISIHYKDAAMMNRLIASVVADLSVTTLRYEILVVDNSGGFVLESELSSLGSLRVLEMGYNAGFARGVNTGFKAAQGRFIAMMNQDALVMQKDTFSTLIAQLGQLPTKTVLGCRLVDEEGAFQQSIWEEDPGFAREWRFSAFYQKIHPQWQVLFEARKLAVHHQSGFVHRINGAFFLMRNDSFLQEAMYDEDFFLYGEDVEWALRIKRLGWRFYHDARTVVTHAGSASSPDVSLKLHQIVLSDWLALRKLYGRFYLLLYWYFALFQLIVKQLLFHMYRLRKGHYPKESYSYFLQEKNRFYTLFGMYSWKLFFWNRFSNAHSFKFNYYRDAQNSSW